jgi:ABA DEFICIENT 4-like
MADSIFSLVNLLAIAGWLSLAVLPRRIWAERLSTWAIPGLLAGLYVAIVAVRWGQSPGGFSSLAAVRQLFDDRWMLLAGWVHYLAFDLLVGCWIVRDARARGIAHPVLLPLLLLTFLFGPAGWVSYLGVRAALRKRSSPGGQIYAA